MTYHGNSRRQLPIGIPNRAVALGRFDNGSPEDHISRISSTGFSQKSCASVGNHPTAKVSANNFPKFVCAPGRRWKTAEGEPGHHEKLTGFKRGSESPSQFGHFRLRKTFPHGVLDCHIWRGWSRMGCAARRENAQDLDDAVLRKPAMPYPVIFLGASRATTSVVLSTVVTQAGADRL